jgi:hypothetical protein
MDCLKEVKNPDPEEQVLNSPLEGDALWQPCLNPNIEFRNSKWFDRLTILSKVEGQIRNHNVQISKTKKGSILSKVHRILFLLFRILVIRYCFGFRASDFEFTTSNIRQSHLSLTRSRGLGFLF